jgi:hypothetical protein
MWLLFTRNAKTRVVRDGDSFVETCPECRRRARFDEVEITESVGVWFVDLLSDTERKYRCSACGEVFDLRDEPGEPGELEDLDELDEPPAKSAAELARERAALEARREAAATAEAERRREQAVAKANRIEDELAELKKRLGR